VLNNLSTLGRDADVALVVPITGLSATARQFGGIVIA
jgi:hypothetical protein